MRARWGRRVASARTASLAAALLVWLVSAVPRSATAADDIAAAREHYSNGKRAYDVGHFAEAAHEYELAYQAKDDPAFLFNLGQASRLAGNYSKAVIAYRAYLRNVPDSPDRDQVELRIKEMEAVLRAQAKTAEGPPQGIVGPLTKASATTTSTGGAATPTAAASVDIVANANVSRPSTPLYKRWWLWTAIGVVAAGAAAGIAVGVTRSPASSQSMLTPVVIQ